MDLTTPSETIGHKLILIYCFESSKNIEVEIETAVILNAIRVNTDSEWFYQFHVEYGKATLLDRFSLEFFRKKYIKFPIDDFKNGCVCYNNFVSILYDPTPEKIEKAKLKMISSLISSNNFSIRQDIPQWTNQLY